MRLTKAHTEFWHAHKSKSLRGAPAIASPSIHKMVNDHAGIRMTSGEMAANNLLVILRSARRRGRSELLQVMLQMAFSPGTVMSAERRAGYCLKWYTKIIANNMKAIRETHND